MKTQKGLQAVVVLLVLGLSTGLVKAQSTADDFSENFESYSPGMSITNVTGWTASQETSVIVATNYSAHYVGGDYPIPGDHTQVLKVDSGVKKTLSPGTLGVDNWADMVIKPVFSDSLPALPDVGTVAAVHFNSNGTLMVMHTPSNTTDYAEWVEIPEVTVGEDEWIRLTIRAYYGTIGTPGSNLTRFYQVVVNSTNLVTHPTAFLEPTRPSGTDPEGSWFGNRIARIQSSTVTNVIFEGNGYLDDLVVTNQDVFDDDPPPTTELTIEGTFVVSNKVYDATTDVSGYDISGLGFVQDTEEDDVYLATVTLQFAQAGVGTDIEVTITGATLGGDDFENYTLSLTGAIHCR